MYTLPYLVVIICGPSFSFRLTARRRMGSPLCILLPLHSPSTKFPSTSTVCLSVPSSGKQKLKGLPYSSKFLRMLAWNCGKICTAFLKCCGRCAKICPNKKFQTLYFEKSVQSMYTHPLASILSTLGKKVNNFGMSLFRLACTKVIITK